MSQIMIPKAQAEAPVGDGGNGVFPKGSWCGVIDAAVVRDLPPWAGDDGNNGFSCEDGEVLNLQFGSNRPLDGQDEIGEKKHFVAIVVRDGEETVETVDVGDRDCAAWKLQQGARMLANLGIALGQTEELETEEGEVMTVVEEDFLENLREGAFGGHEVAFAITHRPWKTDDKSGTEVNTKEFFQAV